MARNAQWTDLLLQHVEEWRNKPLAYGSADCFQFVAEWVSKCTGKDYRGDFPAYETERDAKRIIASAGGHAQMLDTCLGDRKPIAFAKRGDVLLFDHADGLSPGICLGVNSCVFRIVGGLEFVPTLSATMRWEV